MFVSTADIMYTISRRTRVWCIVINGAVKVHKIRRSEAIAHGEIEISKVRQILFKKVST